MYTNTLKIIFSNNFLERHQDINEELTEIYKHKQSPLFVFAFECVTFSIQLMVCFSTYVAPNDSCPRADLHVLSSTYFIIEP